MSANPWRRKTPTPSNLGSPIKSSTSLFDGTDGWSNASAASTPRKKIKPKLTRLITGYTSGALSTATPEPFSTEQWSAAPPSPRPCLPDDIDQMAQAIMTNLLTSPHGGLPASFNHLVMQVIESRSSLRRKQVAFETELQAASAAKSESTARSHRVNTNFNHRMQTYEAEVKRLKTTIAQISEDQGSHIETNEPRKISNTKGKGRARETIYEFLKSSQHVSVQEEPQGMKPRASQITTFSPRSSIDRSSFETSADDMSDDVDSTNDVGRDEDFGHVRLLAEVMARRRDMKLQDALDRLCEVFFQDIGRPSVSTQSSSGFSDSVDLEILFQTPAKSHGPARGEPHTEPVQHRRAFSFDDGDDTTIHFSTSHGHTVVDRSPLYKRSVSLTNLPSHPVQSGFSLSQAMAEAAGPSSTTAAVAVAGSKSSDVHSNAQSPRSAVNPRGEGSQCSSWRPKNPRRQTSSSSTGTVLRRSPMVSTSALLRGP